MGELTPDPSQRFRHSNGFVFGQIGDVCAIPTASAAYAVDSHELSFLRGVGPGDDALRRRAGDPFFDKKGHVPIDDHTPIPRARVGATGVPADHVPQHGIADLEGHFFHLGHAFQSISRIGFAGRIVRVGVRAGHQ